MALLTLAVWDTEDNQRTDLTRRTLESLLLTVDFTKHRLVISDNGSCEATHKVYDSFMSAFLLKYSGLDKATLPTILFNGTNLGTAKAVNKGLRLRKPGEHCIKLDNDVVVHKAGWVDDMEEVLTRMPKIGILGLKRPDLQESMYAISPDQRSKLLEVPHEHGQRWRVVEECKQVMGTCTMLNHALLDKVGYFYQMDGLYGFDDSILCVRSTVAGFLNCFLHGIDIDHIDPGGTEYTDWKQKYAGEMLNRWAETERAYKSVAMDVYYDGD